MNTDFEQKETKVTKRRGDSKVFLARSEKREGFTAANEFFQCWSQVLRDAQFQAKEQRLCAGDWYNLVLLCKPVEVPFLAHQLPGDFLRRHAASIEEIPIAVNEIVPVFHARERFIRSVPRPAPEIDTAEVFRLVGVVDDAFDGFSHKRRVA